MIAHRRTIEFESGPERVLCRGWFYPAPRGNAPIIVMGHGLGAVKEMRLDAYADAFAMQGYACLVFDYRGFGTSDGQPRQVIDIPMQLDDWRAAVAHARTLCATSPVILWGSSFSGGHVLTIAAGDGQIGAVISQCPHMSGPAAIRQLSFKTVIGIGVRAVCDLVAKALKRQPMMVPLAAPVGEVGLMNSPGAYLIAKKLLESAGAAAPPEQVAARIGLFIGAYSPGRSAKHVGCPILFCLCTMDNVAPAVVAKHFALQAPRAEVREYPVGHFDIYMGEPFEHAITDQIDFLARHFPIQSMAKLPRTEP